MKKITEALAAALGAVLSFFTGLPPEPEPEPPKPEETEPTE